MNQTATAAQTVSVPGKVKRLVVNHDQKRKHFPSIDIGEMACVGTEIVDIGKISLIPMTEGISINENLKRIAAAGKLHMDAHAMEAFLESPFAIPERFADRKIFFGGCQDNEGHRGSLYVMFMLEGEDGNWKPWFIGVGAKPPSNSYAACVEKKELL